MTWTLMRDAISFVLALASARKEDVSDAELLPRFFRMAGDRVGSLRQIDRLSARLFAPDALQVELIKEIRGQADEKPNLAQAVEKYARSLAR